jgi:hypothetical protein
MVSALRKRTSSPCSGFAVPHCLLCGKITLCFNDRNVSLFIFFSSEISL